MAKAPLGVLLLLSASSACGSHGSVNDATGPGDGAPAIRDAGSGEAPPIFATDGGAFDEAGNGDADAAPLVIKTLGLGPNNVCVLATNGSVCCWGANADGQLGVGSTDSIAAAVPVTALGTNVVELAVGMGNNACALKSDGTVWCWGNGELGQNGNGESMGGVAALPTQVTALGTDVEHLFRSRATMCAQKHDGTFWCWGQDPAGDLGPGSTAFALGQLTMVPDVAEVNLGSTSASCVLKTDGTVWCWGDNSDDELGVEPPPMSSLMPFEINALGSTVTHVSVGGDFACATKADGTVWCWGRNQIGQLGAGTGADPTPTPVQVTGLSADPKRTIVAMWETTCALSGDGTLWCWGASVGNGTMNSSATPVQVMTLGSGVTALTTDGVQLACALKTDGSIWCWGSCAVSPCPFGDPPIVAPERLPSSFVCDGKTPPPVLQ